MENKPPTNPGIVECCFDMAEFKKVLAKEMNPMVNAIKDLTSAIQTGSLTKAIALNVLKEINDHIEVQKIAESAVVVREADKVIVPESPPRKVERKRAARISTGGRLKKKLNTRESRQQREEKSAEKENVDMTAKNGSGDSQGAASSDGRKKPECNTAVKTEKEKVARYYELLLRSYPGIRTDKDLALEKLTGVHTGCSKCRRDAFQASKGLREFDIVYHDLVRDCKHVGLGEEEKDPLHW